MPDIFSGSILKQGEAPLFYRMAYPRDPSLFLLGQRLYAERFIMSRSNVLLVQAAKINVRAYCNQRRTVLPSRASVPKVRTKVLIEHGHLSGGRAFLSQLYVRRQERSTLQTVWVILVHIWATPTSTTLELQTHSELERTRTT